MPRNLSGYPLIESMLGDLHEERRRRAEISPVLAAIWFWWHAVTIVTYLSLTHVVALMRATASALRAGMTSCGRELRHATRALRQAPWFSLAVIGVLTLGMALATTVFAVVDGVLFKPLPYAKSNELVSIQAGIRATNGSVTLRPWLSATDVSGWRGATPDVAFTVFRTYSSSRFSETNEAPLEIADVDLHFFDVVGVRPLIGGFSTEHFAGAPPATAAIISHQLWKTRFGARPDIVGQRLSRGTASIDVAGVLPPDFVFPARDNAHILMPLRLSVRERSDPAMRSFQGIARIPSVIPVEAVRTRLESAGAFDRVAVQPLGDWLSRQSRPLFLAVFTAVAGLVLLACVNVSGLITARSLDRQREIDLRRALGARSEHLVAFVLAETALLVVCSTLSAITLTGPALRIVAQLLPLDLALLKTPAIDWRVVVFAAMATTVCVAGISVWPIRRGLRSNSTAALAASSRGAVRTGASGRFVVVSLQIAIGLVLTVGGALLVGSLVRLHQEEIGFDPHGVLAVELRVPGSVADARPGGAEGVVTRIVQNLRSTPGVSVAGATDAPLLQNMMWKDDGWVPPAGARTAGYLNVHGITAGFFDVVRPRVIAGRLPSNEELDAGRQVLVVSESIAKAFWPDNSAVGETLSYTYANGAPFTVVGIVADARFAGWDEDRFQQIYAPLTALRRRSTSPNILLRTDSAGLKTGGSRVLSELQRFMNAEGADVRAVRAVPLTTMLADTVRQRRFQSWLFGSFAVASLAIVAVGVLGLMAMAAARRTREVGVRMALGATPDSIVRLIVREQFAAVAAGVIAGGFLAAWAVRFLRAYLYELTPHDPRLWIVAVLLVVGTASLGMLIPALRASRIDPVQALRIE